MDISNQPPKTPAATPAPESATSSAQPEPTTQPAADTTKTSSEPATPAAASGDTSVERKILAIPTSAMKNIKQEERERGKSEALAALDAEAVSLGFANYAELRAYAKTQKETTSKSPTPAPTPDAGIDDDDDDLDDEPVQAEPPKKAESKRNRDLVKQLELDREKLLEEKRRLNRARSREVRENKQLKRQLQELETTSELKLQAKDAGVADVDYAVELLKRNLRTMSDAELAGFDERKFFREILRKTHPHLYKAEERPVTTGVQDTPPPPAAGKPEKAANGSDHKAVDARALSPKEFRELLQKRGISNPASGGMMS